MDTKFFLIQILVSTAIGLATPLPTIAQHNLNLSPINQNQSTVAHCGTSGPGNPCSTGPGGFLHNSLQHLESGPGHQFYTGPGLNAMNCPSNFN